MLLGHIVHSTSSLSSPAVLKFPLFSPVHNDIGLDLKPSCKMWISLVRELFCTQNLLKGHQPRYWGSPVRCSLVTTLKHKQMWSSVYSSQAQQPGPEPSLGMWNLKWWAWVVAHIFGRAEGGALKHSCGCLLTCAHLCSVPVLYLQLVHSPCLPPTNSVLLPSITYSQCTITE